MASVRFARSRTYPRSPDDAYRTVIGLPLPQLFARRFGPMPPIREVRGQDGEWGTVGQTRTIVLADGGTLHETLTETDPPSAFGYRIDEVTGPMRPLVDHVEGRWSFDPVGDGGVRITWTWDLHPRSPLTARLLPVLERFWNGYADRALQTLEDALVGSS